MKIKGLLNLIKVPKEACSVKRWLLLGFSLLIMSFGIAFSIKADLGTSPVSSVPYVVSLFTPLTVGTATIAMHCFFVVLQVLILRKKYQPFQLLQLGVAFAFGYLTDFALFVTEHIAYTNYVEQILLCVAGIFCIGIGVWMQVRAKVITLAGEGVMLAICQVKGFKFSNVKIAFDVSLVLSACILGLLFAGGIQGVREGTVAAAVCVGLVTKATAKIASLIQNYADSLSAKDQL